MSEQKNVEMVPVSKSEFIDEIEKTFELSDVAAALVSISNISGSITVEAWDQPTVTIRAFKRARSQRSFDRIRVEILQNGDEISARTLIDEETILAGVMDFLRGDRAGAMVDYTVRLPAASAVRAKTVNGSVNLTGLSSDSVANAVNGSVNLKRISGKLNASTVNGALKAEGLSGAADLDTVNGQITLSDVHLTTLEARTVSGDVHAALSIEPSGSYAINSTNGSCELVIPPDSRCDVSMQAVNGGVEVRLPHTTTASEMRPAFSHWQGKVNGGGAPISFRTVNGRLRIASSADSEPPRASDSTQSVETDAASTMDILRAVERGELSVDQAMQKMRESKPKDRP